MSDITGFWLLCQICILTLSNHSCEGNSLFPRVELTRKKKNLFYIWYFCRVTRSGACIFHHLSNSSACPYVLKVSFNLNTQIRLAEDFTLSPCCRQQERSKLPVCFRDDPFFVPTTFHISCLWKLLPRLIISPFHKSAYYKQDCHCPFGLLEEGIYRCGQILYHSFLKS